MKTLVIGGGGREHAIAWRLAKSASVTHLFAAPGNPGIAEIAECLPSSGSPADLLEVANAVDADLTVVGPEAPLVDGVVDVFRAADRRIVGPTAAAAQLEGSKVFSKNFMQEAGIPTARFATADTLESARRALAAFQFPVVLKADGLAAGKGVVICQTLMEADSILTRMFSGQLVGGAGSRVVIEEFLTGEEVSFIVLTDGVNVIPLQPTQDHKPVFDGDTGANTGGMGAYCDSRILSATETGDILETIIHPTLAAMRDRGTPFAGFLYAGLMMTPGGIRVLEYNVRLGDPETQALMYRLDDDFGEILVAAADGNLSDTALHWSSDPSVCVVMAAGGYPAQARTGKVIHGIAEAEATGATVFQAGTTRTEQGLETAAGRVLGVTASGSTLKAAIDNAYAGVAHIRFEGMHYRKDIGRKGLRRYNEESPGT